MFSIFKSTSFNILIIFKVYALLLPIYLFTEAQIHILFWFYLRQSFFESYYLRLGTAFWLEHNIPRIGGIYCHTGVKILQNEEFESLYPLLRQVSMPRDGRRDMFGWQNIHLF